MATDRRIVVRADASSQIGLGHFMRCLALADAAREYGVKTLFLARDLPESCSSMLTKKGHEQAEIKAATAVGSKAGHIESVNPHSHWLAVSQQQDAVDCIQRIRGMMPDWLIADHYALDAVWEEALAPHCKKLMVIDDLADRPHFCNLLVDQNLGRKPEDYFLHLRQSQKMLIGPHFSLLRPEFAKHRLRSLTMRDARSSKRVLLAMGGADNDNVTGAVLRSLLHSNIPSNIEFKIVLGAQAKWIEPVQESASLLGGRASVHVGVDTMADLMAECDLAIGAAGGSAWERCCLGLPSLLLVVAENQRAGAQALQAAGAAIILKAVDDIPKRIISLLEDCGPRSVLAQMSQSARQIVDGRGLERVLDKMFNYAGL